MENLVILVLVAALSAWVVVRTIAPSKSRGRSDLPRRRPFQSTIPERPSPAPEPSPTSDPGGEGFILLRGSGPASPDDRPPRTLSVLRIAVVITFVAAVGVAAMALLGLLVKIQLDQYFAGR